MKIAWDTSHQEFIISDHYYFSRLLSLINEMGWQIEEVDRFSDLAKFDTIIFNYPEIPFSNEEANLIEHLVREEGKRVAILGYYKNEDHIADTCNTLSVRFGIKFNGDIITDKVNNYEGDELFLTTSCSKITSISKLALACTDTLSIDGNATPLVEAEESSTSSNGKILFASRKFPSGGEFIAGGTCVFWDNYSIDIADNRKLAKYILAGTP